MFTVKPPTFFTSPWLSLAPGLWRGLAFIAPLNGQIGSRALLDKNGKPLAGSNLVSGSTLQWRRTPYGLGVGVSGSSNLLMQDNFEPIVTSDGVGTGDLTMVVLANPISESRISWGLAQGNDADNTNLWLGFNNAAGSVVTATAGMFCFSTRNGANNTNASVAGAIDGNYHLFGGRRSGTTVDAFVDGIAKGTNSGTVRDIMTGALGLAIGNRPEGNTFRLDTGCTIVFAAAWNRALSNAEMRMLAIDPFCMFRVAANDNFHYLLGGTSGAGSISLSPTSVAGVGKVIFKGAGALSLAAPVVSGAGKERFTATGVISLSPLAVPGAGKEIFTASGAMMLRSLSVSAAGSHTESGVTSGSGAIGLAPMSVSGVGKVMLKGTGTISLTPAGVSASGKELFKATGAVNLAPVTVSASAKESFRGIGAVSLAPFTASSIGKEILRGAASISLRPLSVVGAGTYTGGAPVQTYAVEIVVLADAREFVIIDDPRELVVN